MTKPLDPEIKAHRAILRALRGVPLEVQQRILRYWVDRGGYLAPTWQAEDMGTGWSDRSSAPASEAGETT